MNSYNITPRNPNNRLEDNSASTKTPLKSSDIEEKVKIVFYADFILIYMFAGYKYICRVGIWRLSHPCFATTNYKVFDLQFHLFPLVPL